MQRELGQRNGKLFAFNYPNNATGIKLLGWELTFWHRAMSSMGRTEAYLHSQGLHAMINLFGYGLSTQLTWSRNKPHRTLWCHTLPRWTWHRSC